MPGHDRETGIGAAPVRGGMLDNKPIVVVTRRLPETTEARMQELFDTRLNEGDTLMSEAALVAAMQEADVLVPTVTDHISA